MEQFWILTIRLVSNNWPIRQGRGKLFTHTSHAETVNQEIATASFSREARCIVMTLNLHCLYVCSYDYIGDIYINKRERGSGRVAGARVTQRAIFLVRAHNTPRASDSPHRRHLLKIMPHSGWDDARSIIALNNASLFPLQRIQSVRR